LQQIGNATRMYAEANHDHYPDDWTVGLAIYRRGYLETTPSDPFSVPEIYGLPALYNINGYIKTNKVWICPAANEKFKEYKNTYIWMLMTRTVGGSSPKPLASWTSRTRGDPKFGSLFWVSENLTNAPPATGLRYSGTGAPIDPSLKSQLLPHPYRTKITYDVRRGAMNILFMDGSIGVGVYTPSGNSILRE
jgi:hypothetical protein